MTAPEIDWHFDPIDAEAAYLAGMFFEPEDMTETVEAEDASRPSHDDGIR